MDKQKEKDINTGKAENKQFKTHHSENQTIHTMVFKMLLFCILLFGFCLFITI